MQKPVLLILPSLHAAGTENYVLRLIKFAGVKRYRWHVLSLDPSKGDLHDQYLSAGATIHYQPIGYGNPWKLYRLYRLIKTLRVESICTFTGNFGGLALTIGRLGGIKKRIGWYRATEPAYKPSLIKATYDKLANYLLWTNATQILSNSNAALLRHKPKSNYRVPAQVLDNGVDASFLDNQPLSRVFAKAQLAISADTFTVCHVGRIAPAKNHETILKTIKEVKRQKGNVRFIFCGKGTDSEGFLSNLAEHQIDDLAITLGLRDDLNLVFSASDLFYFPSVTEGQPNALIEAMISGVPILASNILPIREVVPVELHDSLIDPRDWQTAADTIVSMSVGQVKPPTSCRDYAIARFNPERAFKSFLDLL